MRYTEDGITAQSGSMYVWLDCERYGLPDTTNGNVGLHVAYLPVCDLDPDLRRRCCEISAKAEALQIESDNERELAELEVGRQAFDAWETKLGRPNDPAAVETWRAAIAQKRREWDRGMNEGGDGYNPYRFGG